MTLVNLTPHPIDLETTSGEVITVTSSGQARLGEITEDLGVIEVADAAVRRVRITYAAADLPEEESGFTFIVPALVAQRHPERTDLVYPAQLVRDANGQILYARALARFSAEALES